ncbi:MAG: hypothetical protein U0132_24040 [Gemmatimonadaceae bacterium]
MRHHAFIPIIVLLVSACGSSTASSDGALVITGTAFSTTLHQNENNTLNLELTNGTSRAFQFESNICPGTLQVYNSQQQLVHDARYFPFLCSAFSAIRTLAPGETFRWQEGLPAMFVATSGGALTVPPPGTYQVVAGAWYWSSHGKVESTPVTITIVP